MPSCLTSGFLLLSLLLQIGTNAAPLEPGHDLLEDTADGDVDARRNMLGTLSVIIVRGIGLNGDKIGDTDAFARMWYGAMSFSTPKIKSDNPTWNAVFNLGHVETHLPLKVEVWDQDVANDDCLISCTHYLTQGTHTFTCQGNGQVEVNYSLTCDPGLTGNQCELYQ
ncbi:perforin-1-like [Xiphophorus couchianus]|uniref:perforin-1-like n=1 Tax=Xiphophorus couchianus TaxID=32473 RepID=UPI0010171B45|nr:perforin-1-like [Xiphophorus couchianus]